AADPAGGRRGRERSGGGRAGRDPGQVPWLCRASEGRSRAEQGRRSHAPAGGHRLRRGAWPFHRGAPEAQPAAPGNRGPGLAHPGRDARRHLPAAGASQAPYAAESQEVRMTPQHQTLRRAAAAMGVALSDAAVDKLLAYQALMIKWNRTYNLTAIRDPEEMLVHHLLDSLVVAPLLPHGPLTLADVGSGGGLPGIPLAIARPEIQVTLIETSSKKSAFQQQVKIELG